MLVLSRQKDETIMIGDDVEITVVDIRGDKVRLGIKAPPHIPVHRKEVYEAIRRENKAAAQISPDDLKSVSNSKVTPAEKSPQGAIEPEKKAQPDNGDSSKSLESEKMPRRQKPADNHSSK
jgi:carbon storage regulator